MSGIFAGLSEMFRFILQAGGKGIYEIRISSGTRVISGFCILLCDRIKMAWVLCMKKEIPNLGEPWQSGRMTLVLRRQNGVR